MKASLRREHYRNYVCAHTSPLCCDLSTGPLGERLDRRDAPPPSARSFFQPFAIETAISNSMGLATRATRLDSSALSSCYCATFVLICESFLSSSFRLLTFPPPFLSVLPTPVRVFQFRCAYHHRCSAYSSLKCYLYINGFRDFA